MFMEKDLNEGVGVYTLNSGVVIVIEGVHNDEPCNTIKMNRGILCLKVVINKSSPSSEGEVCR